MFGSNYNFQKDSIAFYAKGVIKTLARGGEDSIAVRNSVNDLVTELKDQEFQFNENLTLLILSRKEGVSVKEDATYSLDEKKKTQDKILKLEQEAEGPAQPVRSRRPEAGQPLTAKRRLLRQGEGILRHLEGLRATPHRRARVTPSRASPPIDPGHAAADPADRDAAAHGADRHVDDLPR